MGARVEMVSLVLSSSPVLVLPVIAAMVTLTQDKEVTDRGSLSERHRILHLWKKGRHQERCSNLLVEKLRQWMTL